MGLSNIRIVLVEPSHPGNIGAAARAMKTMGLERMVLVQPRRFPSSEADSRAVGALDVLESAVVTADLPSAIAGCKLVVGVSGRAREYSLPEIDARAGGLRIAREAAEHPVAVLFGPEQGGLSNRSLDACAYQLKIPANPDFKSLNLAAAVQLVGYEIFLAAVAGELAGEREREAYPSPEELEFFYQHLERTLAERDFASPINPDKVNAKLRRFISRARPRSDELRLLHGLVRLMYAESDDER